MTKVFALTHSHRLVLCVPPFPPDMTVHLDLNSSSNVGIDLLSGGDDAKYAMTASIFRL